MSKHRIGRGRGAHHAIDPTRLDENSIIVDAGACEGWIIKNIRHLGIKSKIYAIEPDRNNIEKLKELDAEVVPKALTGSKRTETFYQTNGKPEWGNIYNYHKEKPLKSAEYQVETITLDEFEKIDYLKMVIEGCELEVVESLKEASIPQISVQNHWGDYDKIKVRLKELGYEIIEFPHNEIYAFTR